MMSRDDLLTLNDSNIELTPQSSTLEDDSNCSLPFLNTPCFKYTKLVLIVLYALNIVAWGGMLFLILVGAANQTMPDEQTRKIWIEIDSQILNALFCVTGLGFIPCRVRDLYQFYNGKHRNKVLKRNSYTSNLIWIQVIMWCFMANSFFQIGMALSMWCANMDTRPAWVVGLFVGLGCLSGLFAGLASLILGKCAKNEARADIEHSETL